MDATVQLEPINAIETNGEEQSQTREQEIEKTMEEFLAELKRPDPSWEKCSTTDTLSVYRKWDETSGIYRIKIIGRIAYKPEVVYTVLFDHGLRRAWDKVIDKIVELEKVENAVVLHISAVSPVFGIANRDFVHIRSEKLLPKDGGRLILDISTTHPKCPQIEGCIRAETTCSGGLLESTFIPNIKSKTLDCGTLYSMVSHVDLKGIIPKPIVNFVSTRSTADWFESLSKACEQYSKGELIPAK